VSAVLTVIAVVAMPATDKKPGESPAQEKTGAAAVED